MTKIKAVRGKVLSKKASVQAVESILTKKYIGRIGESAAEVYLKNKGHLILGKNVRFRRGEVDLISKYEDTLHVVEVKTGIFYVQNDVSPETIRLEDGHIVPEDSFSNRKIAKLKYLADRVFAKYSGKAVTGFGTQSVDTVVSAEGVQVDGIAVRIYAHKVRARPGSEKSKRLMVDRVTVRYYPAL